MPHERAGFRRHRTRGVATSDFSELALPSRYQGALHCLRLSLSTEGPAFLFRGLSSTILRAFPTNAATFAAVAWTMRLLQSEQLQDAVHDVQKDVHHAVESVRAPAFEQHQHAFLEWVALHCQMACEH